MGEDRPAVVITGGGQRLGAATARRFAQAGWHVVVHCHRSQDAAERLLEDLGRLGGSGEIVVFDLAEPEATEAAFTDLCRRTPHLRILVNNASVFDYDAPRRPEPEVFARAMAVNCAAPMALSALFVRLTAGADRSGANVVPDEGPSPQASSSRGLSGGPRGHPQTVDGPPLGRPDEPGDDAERVDARVSADRAIVNVLDQKLANPNPDYYGYTVSKAALAEASRLMAMAFAPEVRVVNVAPGLTLPSGDQTEAEFGRSAALNLLQRRTRVEEVAGGIYFVGTTAAYASGQTLFVDSGQHFVEHGRDVMFLVRGEDETR
jgi:NAD(P)-dependent dehydrogenase (short-subunit alcohol dehydrogenase family)